MEILQILAITSSIAWVIIIVIKEYFKERRIKLLKDIHNSKIETIGNYELKSSLKEQFKNTYIVQYIKSIISKADES